MKSILLSILMTVAIPFAIAQNIDREPNLNLSVISTQGESGVGVYSADAFTFYGLDYAPEEITFYGKRSSATFIEEYVTGFNIFFYHSDNGMPDGNPENPGSGFWELKNIDLQYVIIYEDEHIVNFTIDILGANNNEHHFFPRSGILWMSAFPTVTGSPTGEGRWNWHGSNDGGELYPVLIDPNNLFGEGITSWTKVDEVIGNIFPSFAWKMTGIHIDPVSVEDHQKKYFKVFPNPTNEEIFIASDFPIEKIEIYDVYGKLILCERYANQIDLRKISSGIYFISMESATEKFIQKIIKN